MSNLTKITKLTKYPGGGILTALGIAGLVTGCNTALAHSRSLAHADTLAYAGSMAAGPGGAADSGPCAGHSYRGGGSG